MASKLNIQASLMQKEMAKGTVADWAQFDGKVDAEIVAEVKGVRRAPRSPLALRTAPPAS